LDATALFSDQELYDRLNILFLEFGLEERFEKIEEIAFEEDLLDTIPEPTYSTGKLHYIFEKGNKCRIIAIIDYFTQEVLNPLHLSLNKILRKIEMDSTFNQDSGFERVKGFTLSHNRSVYSYDLSAATDRLPLRLQRDILAELTDEGKANA